MKYRNCVYTMAAALLVACSLAVSGCSDKKAEEPAPPAVSYGVVDLETLVKAHPKYSTYFRLETEYNHLLDQYQNERNKLIHVASQQQHIKAALSDQSRRMAAENEWKTKVKAKEDELNDGLAKLYKTINEAHKKDRTFTPDGLTDEERAEMANLQMKLTVLGVTGSEKEDVKLELSSDQSVTIKRVRVAKGRRISAGDVLFEAEVSGYDKEMESLRSDYDASQKKLLELERKNGCLSCDTDQIRNRYHKRHGNRSLSGTRGDHTVDK